MVLHQNHHHIAVQHINIYHQPERAIPVELRSVVMWRLKLHPIIITHQAMGYQMLTVRKLNILVVTIHVNYMLVMVVVKWYMELHHVMIRFIELYSAT